jgi:hypothetical protein
MNYVLITLALITASSANAYTPDEIKPVCREMKLIAADSKYLAKVLKMYDIETQAPILSLNKVMITAEIEAGFKDRNNHRQRGTSFVFFCVKGLKKILDEYKTH